MRGLGSGSGRSTFTLAGLRRLIPASFGRINERLPIAARLLRGEGLVPKEL